MNKIVYDLLLKLEECDDFHNRCDYLMEHDEITYLLEFIKDKDKEIERLNNIINELEKWLEEKQDLVCGCGITPEYIYAYENCLDRLKELKENN